MKYSTWSQDAALAVLATLREEKGAVLMALQALQKEFGYVHKEDVTLVANFFNKSRADVHGVLTFYHDLLTEAPADNHISVCVAEDGGYIPSRFCRNQIKFYSLCLNNCCQFNTFAVTTLQRTPPLKR